MMKRYTAIIGILTLSLAAFVGVGQGCGEALDAGAGGGSSITCSPDEAIVVIDKDYDVLPGERTVSIAYGQQMLDSFLSCTGVEQASQRTLDEFASRNQSLSEYGSLTDVSAAQMMATAAVAAEVCQDLIIRERGLASVTDRYIFRDADLGGAGLLQSEIESAVELLALSCWQRPSLDVEEVEIANAVLQMNTSSENGALGLCTAMLSSLAAIEQ